MGQFYRLPMPVPVPVPMPMPMPRMTTLPQQP
jgi:hypothetical protein